jgi:hypothetical protein
MKAKTLRTEKQIVGDAGEKEIAELAPCPNCGKRLRTFPKNYPLYDVQCECCFFRAQVKTRGSSPKSVVRGAGWDIINKVLKAGFLAPPLIVNFKWRDGKRKQSEILFFPFITKEYMGKYRLGKGHRQEGYEMFNYVSLKKLPHFQLVTEGKKRIWRSGGKK